LAFAIRHSGRQPFGGLVAVPASLLHWISAYGPAAIFVLLALGVFGLPVPDETLLTFCGALVRRGHLHFIPTVIAAIAGSMGGITLSYVVGRTLGLGAVDRFGRWMHVTRADLARVERWFEHSGRWVLTFGYFIPGVRHFTALVAGSASLPVPVFARYAYSGAAIWVLTFVTIGWYVGPAWETALATAHRHTAVLGVAVGVIAVAYVVAHRWWLRRRR
jgi:membrane protein DedA with SNARE-associated domain